MKNNKSEIEQNFRDVLMWKLSEDKNFQDKILSDFEFAKKEFMKAGINLQYEQFEKLKKAYNVIQETSDDLFGVGTTTARFLTISIS